MKRLNKHKIKILTLNFYYLEIGEWDKWEVKERGYGDGIARGGGLSYLHKV